MEEKKVMASDDIIFEDAHPVVRITKGTVFLVEEVVQGGVILNTSEGERYLIDFDTFEAGFEAVL